MLPMRKKKDFKTAHVFSTVEGFLCLDFNTFATDIDKLKEVLISKIKNLSEDEILPAAPEKLWLDYAAAPMATFIAVKCEECTRGGFTMLIRGVK